MSEHVMELMDSTFEQDVLQSEQPVLVDFGAEWCPPCRLIEPTVAALAEQYAGQVRVGKMDMDGNSAVPQRYGIRGIPTLILFKGGKEEERMVGAASKEAIKRMIDKHAGVASSA